MGWYEPSPEETRVGVSGGAGWDDNVGSCLWATMGRIVFCNYQDWHSDVL